MRLWLYTLLVVVACALAFGARRLGALDLAGGGIASVTTDGTTVVGNGSSGAPIAVKTPLPGAAGGVGVTVSNAPSGAGQCLASTGTTTAAYGSCGSGNMPTIGPGLLSVQNGTSAAWGPYPGAATNVKDYGAVSSSAWTTGTISSGSPTLTLAAAKDFANGQGIVVQGAGGVCTMTSGSTACSAVTSPQPTITAVDTGSVTESYKIACMDGFTPGGATNAIAKGGTAIAGTAGSAVNAILGTPSGANSTNNTISWTACPDSFAAVYRQDNGTGDFYLVAAVDSDSCAAGTCTYHDFHQNSINGCWGTAGSPVICNSSYAPIYAPALAPSAVVNDLLLSYIVSGGGTTTLTLHDNAATTVGASDCDGSQASGACVVDHSEDRAFAATTTAAGKNPVYIPAGTYSLFRTWLFSGSIFGASVNTAAVIPSSWGGSVLLSHVVGNGIQANSSGLSVEIRHIGIFGYGLGGDLISLPATGAGRYPIVGDVNSVGGHNCFGDNGSALRQAIFENIYAEGCDTGYHIEGPSNIFQNVAAQCLGCYMSTAISCNNAGGDIIQNSTLQPSPGGVVTGQCGQLEIVNTTCGGTISSDATVKDVVSINSGTCQPATASEPHFLQFSNGIMNQGVWEYNTLPSGGDGNRQALPWSHSGTACVAGNQATAGTTYRCQMYLNSGNGVWKMTGISNN